MTLYIVLCAAMILIALAVLGRPLLKSKATPIALVTLISLSAVGLYWALGHRTWERDLRDAKSMVDSRQDLAANIARLERHLVEQPNDVDAMLNLAEALATQDERAVAGRAGELFELALSKAPNHPKALWYGAIAALSTGKLSIARDRLQTLLVQSPPENIRSIIERQIQDIDQQLGEGQTSSVAAATAVVDVSVSIAPELAKGLDKTTALFVLARDPANPGPPLAVARRTVGDLPLSVTLSDKDAMMAGRGISSVPRVQIVARISKTGTPQAQAGDLFGEATVDVGGAQPAAVKIAINGTVAK